jgi:2-deoxy-D-gluconate 3-dehydrogenase
VSDLPSFDLSGRLAVVTGCTRGIGLAMATALAAAGADVVGASVSMPEDGGEVGRRVLALGRSFTGHRVELADRDAVTAFGRALAEAERPVDVLVNNAGTTGRAPAEAHEDALWDRVLEVDCTAPFVLAREVGRRMLAEGRGKVIFTASLLSFQGGLGVPGYAAAKHGVAGLTKALANEWAGRGVNVNAIAPGYIATDQNVVLQDDPVRSRQILERIPAGRWGRPDDLAGITVFLASAASDYVHGAIIPVDGGWLGR